jgi:hypothetical protein
MGWLPPRQPIAPLVLIVAGVFGLSTEAFSQENISIEKTNIEPGTGRYQIIINPNVRADTFLIDTTTGRTWNLQLTKDKENIWVPVLRRPFPGAE